MRSVALARRGDSVGTGTPLHIREAGRLNGAAGVSSYAD